MFTEAGAIDIVVTTLLKTASSEVVKRGIGVLSDRFKAAFSKEDHGEIKKIIEDEGLFEQVSNIARVSLDDAVFINLTSSLATAEYRTKLFFKVFDICFRASRVNNSDILLEGSFIDGSNLSLFSTIKKQPQIAIDGVRIKIEDTYDGYYAILPIREQAKKFVSEHKERIKDIRYEDDKSYISNSFDPSNISSYRIDSISAGSVYPRYSYIFQGGPLELMKEKIKIVDYSEGINSMIASISNYSSLPLLSEKEISAIGELAIKIQGINLAIQRAD